MVLSSRSTRATSARSADAHDSQPLAKKTFTLTWWSSLPLAVVFVNIILWGLGNSPDTGPNGPSWFIVALGFFVINFLVVVVSVMLPGWLAYVISKSEFASNLVVCIVSCLLILGQAWMFILSMFQGT